MSPGAALLLARRENHAHLTKAHSNGGRSLSAVYIHTVDSEHCAALLDLRCTARITILPPRSVRSAHSFAGASEGATPPPHVLSVPMFHGQPTKQQRKTDRSTAADGLVCACGVCRRPPRPLLSFFNRESGGW